MLADGMAHFCQKRGCALSPGVDIFGLRRKNGTANRY
jgi:hypothetical protein